MKHRVKTVNIDVIIPALNEEQSIEGVIQAIPRPPVRTIIVVDNNSCDRTATLAQLAGAVVVHEPEQGYGAACLRGIATLDASCDIVVFLDADGSDDPSQMTDLIAPIERDTADIVIGSRALGCVAPGALTPQQRVGNFIASQWLRMRFGQCATDLGPFRAIKRTALEELNLCDRNYGWTVEMQIKAAQKGLRYAEIPAHYRCRKGTSKISGTLRGTLGASRKILWLLALHDFGKYFSSNRCHRANK